MLSHNKISTNLYRIAHLNFSAEKSVDSKIVQQAQSARESGLPLDFFLFSPHENIYKSGNLQFLKLPGPNFNSYLSPKIQWAWRLYAAAGSVDWSTYDAVILRFPKLPVGWQYFLRSVDLPVITEHHTNEAAEIRNGGTLIRRLAALWQKRLSKKFLAKVSGFIGVTEEITRIEKKYAQHAPSVTIPNGIKVDNIVFTGFCPFDGKTLNLLFVASRFSSWHGVDRIIRGMMDYQGPAFIKLTLVGTISNELKKMIADCKTNPLNTIRTPGFKYGHELTCFFSEANLAIGSLGLFRNDMKEACTLKVREYTARGIPFIYGYLDPDFTDPCEFALRVPNNANPINIDHVIAFARKVSDIRNLSNKMRNFAQSNLDWRHKLKCTYDFAKYVIRKV